LTSASFRFSLINNATVPLNILALPKLLTLYATSANELLPGDNFSFVPSMGAYDFRIVIHDGNNTWNNVDEFTWGLTKDGVSYVVSLAAGAGVTAATGSTIAVGVTAAVTTALASILAPPVLVPIAIATFWGTAIVSSMAVTALTCNAMDWVMDRMKELEVQSNTGEIRDLDEMEGLAGTPADHPDRLLLFTDVVTDRPVVDAFRSSYPLINVSRVVLTRRNAEIYLSAMMSEFKEWKWSKGFNRKFMIQGGFTLPEPLTPTTWLKTEFEALKLAEVKRASKGLCDKSLVISFQLRGQQGFYQVQIPSDWDEVLVAEKVVPGTRDDQECKKQYIAMCESRSMRVVTSCARRLPGVDETVWDTVDRHDRSLFWVPRRILLNSGDSRLRVMALGGPSNTPGSLRTPNNRDNMQQVSCTWATPSKLKPL